MPASIRTFFDLLPSRIDQAFVGSAARKRRVEHQRGNATVAARGITAVPRRLFVDVAVISKIDAGTGIQRVVRALALGLSEEASEGWSVHFVSAARRTEYRQISWLGQDGSSDLKPIEGRPGDVFLGLDYSLNTIRWHRAQLGRFRRNGGSIWFLVHDLLPLQRPDWFSRNTVIRFQAWLEIIAAIADGFLCNSAQTEQQLRQVLSDRYGVTGGYCTGIIPMGASIRDSMPQYVATPERKSLPHFNSSSPFSLMVGTLEPRKGHMDVIAAFEALWSLGKRDRLVLVGRKGWHVGDLCDRILSHPEFGKNLIWLDDVDDLALEQIYQACEGVIMASLAEGFGLPLIEALGHGKPVLARDLEVFRPHEAHGVRYFPADAGTEVLASHVANWIDDIRGQRIYMTKPDAGWRQSAKEVLRIIGQA